jgi:hypothetical protein
MMSCSLLSELLSVPRALRAARARIPNAHAQRSSTRQQFRHGDQVLAMAIRDASLAREHEELGQLAVAPEKRGHLLVPGATQQPQSQSVQPSSSYPGAEPWGLWGSLGDQSSAEP